MQAESNVPLPLAIDQIVPLFHETVPQPMLRSLLKALLQSYRDSSAYCYKKYRPAQAKDVSGHVRRADMESEMLGVAERFKSVASAETHMFKNYTGTYVELQCGVVRLTESCVPDKEELPRQADFRATLAGRRQGKFVFAADEEVQVQPEHLYGILLHGVDKSSKKRDKCAFACVRFPDQDCAEYVGEIVDLFALFPDVIAEFYGPEEEAEDEFGLTVKPTRKVETA
jgi:hypothetical protein